MLFRSGVSGDGAGVMTQIPWDFFAEEVFLPEDRSRCAVGQLFFEKDEAERLKMKRLVEESFIQGGFQVLGYRHLPVDRTILGKAAAKTEAPPPPPPFDPSKQVGALAPLGFFDPLGFCKMGDEEGFRNLRAAELKHARVAMMASLGAVVQPAIKFPGFDDVPAGLGAVTTVLGGGGFVVLFGISGFLETQVWTEDPKKEPGNFGDPVGLGMYDVDMRNKELNNGRLAMFTAMGLILAELVSGKSGFGQFS